MAHISTVKNEQNTQDFLNFCRFFHFLEIICGSKSRVLPQDNRWQVLQYSFHLQRSHTPCLYHG